MRILFSSYRLDASGVPTYTLTMLRELQRLGHEVRVYALSGGNLAKKFDWSPTIPIDWRPDYIFAQHTPCAYALRDAFPTQRLLYISHGVTPVIDQPPLDANITHWVAINEQVSTYLQQHHIPSDRITMIRNPIDTTVFAPRNTLQTTPRVLFVSNYKKWKNYGRLRDACALLGWSLHAVGSPYRRSRDIVGDINNADLIVSWGRGILEGMSCGRAVCSMDSTPPAGDGYLTTERYFASRTHNFSHFLPDDCRFTDMSVETIARELAQYDPMDGLRNRALIETHHDVRVLASQLLQCAQTYL